MGDDVGVIVALVAFAIVGAIVVELPFVVFVLFPSVMNDGDDVGVGVVATGDVVGDEAVVVTGAFVGDGVVGESVVTGVGANVVVVEPPPLPSPIPLFSPATIPNFVL